MKGSELLRRYEDNWETAMGASFPRENRVVVRGCDLFDSFKESGWMEYLLFVVTGKRDKKLAGILEKCWLYCVNYPDPRLWNNRVASLAGTSKSTAVLGVAAGIAVTEATIYGLRPIQGVADFLLRAKKQIDKGFSLGDIVQKEMVKYRSIYGYGRPLTKEDERIPPMMEFIKNEDLLDGYYLTLAFKVEEELQKKYKMKMNALAVVGGLLCDLKVTPLECYYIGVVSFSAGISSSYVDAIEKPEGAFFPVRISRINYQGVAEVRAWGE